MTKKIFILIQQQQQNKIIKIENIEFIFLHHLDFSIKSIVAGAISALHTSGLFSWYKIILALKFPDYGFEF